MKNQQTIKERMDEYQVQLSFLYEALTFVKDDMTNGDGTDEQHRATLTILCEKFQSLIAEGDNLFSEIVKSNGGNNHE